MYSIGKDSSVLLHLARKAFFPGRIPFPLLHIDTGWKFKEMISFRDETAKRLNAELIVHTNEAGKAAGVTPFTHGARYTDIMKTEALKAALDKYGCDAAIGGARRDEEKSRAKERVFSFRDAQHRWDPKNQRPSSGTSTTAGCAAATASACSRSATGPRSTSGRTSTPRTSRWCRCTSPSLARSLTATGSRSWSTTTACR
jgi:3'-phosphoadenosine 5'-phosphosulfate sulfotransferase (PAPS reductase)/FAD synthetase